MNTSEQSQTPKLAHLRNPYFGNLEGTCKKCRRAARGLNQWQPKFINPSQGSKIDKTNTVQHYSDMHWPMSTILICCRAYARVQSETGTTRVDHSRRPLGEVIFQQSKKPSHNAITASQYLSPPEATVLNMITRPAVKINKSVRSILLSFKEAVHTFRQCNS
jgi:hypothetical protein